jgi:hypothetical protein
MAVRLSALRAGRALPPGIFLVLISVKRLSRPQGHSAAGRIRSIEKIHIIETRTRDLLACSIVPQPTTLPRAPLKEIWFGDNTWINLSEIWGIHGRKYEDNGLVGSDTV